MTMNDTWGYTAFDDAWKSPALLLHTLIETVSMGGNLLLNVGPMGDGRLTPQEIERLAALASWRERHGESLEDVSPGLELWQFHGPSTRREDPNGAARLYLFLVMKPYERIVVRGVHIGRVQSVVLLDGSRELPWMGRPRLRDVHSRSDDPLGELHITLNPSDLDDLCSVIVVDLAPPPHIPV